MVLENYQPRKLTFKKYFQKTKFKKYNYDILTTLH